MKPKRWAKPAEPLFHTGVRLRHELYRRRLLRTRRLDHPVISIGNLSVGGTGKSPLVRYFAGSLQEAGLAPAVLTRGYRGSSESKNRLVSDGDRLLSSAAEAGDEASMLARHLPGIPIAVGKKRWKSGRMIERLHPDPKRVFLLDDGFQHLSLARDLDLVAVDATRPLLEEPLLPAGLLREPPEALSRADAVLLTRCHLVQARLPGLEAEIRSIAPEVPQFQFRTIPTEFRRLGKGEKEEEASGDRAGRKGVVLAALGNPQQFVQDVSRAGVKVVNEFLFRDHHPYIQQELDIVIERTRHLGAEFIVTTEKDAVRLEDLDLRDLPFLALDIRFEPVDRDALNAWLVGRLQRLRNGVERDPGGRKA